MTSSSAQRTSPADRNADTRVGKEPAAVSPNTAHKHSDDTLELIAQMDAALDHLDGHVREGAQVLTALGEAKREGAAMTRERQAALQKLDAADQRLARLSEANEQVARTLIDVMARIQRVIDVRGTKAGATAQGSKGQ